MTPDVEVTVVETCILKGAPSVAKSRCDTRAENELSEVETDDVCDFEQLVMNVCRDAVRSFQEIDFTDRLRIKIRHF